jgi:hypothetical protein
MPNENERVSALISLKSGHTVEEILQILSGRKGVSVREIVRGVVTFNGPESDLDLVRPIAYVRINVNCRLHPDFF